MFSASLSTLRSRFLLLAIGSVVSTEKSHSRKQWYSGPQTKVCDSIRGQLPTTAFINTFNFVCLNATQSMTLNAR